MLLLLLLLPVAAAAAAASAGVALAAAPAAATLILQASKQEGLDTPDAGTQFGYSKSKALSLFCISTARSGHFHNYATSLP